MSGLNIQQEHGITIAKRRTAEDLLDDAGPYARLLHDLVKAAKVQGASDIHIEPGELGIALRLRVDGNLYLHKQVGLEHRESLILEAKRVFGLAIGVSGKPQDGRISLPSMRLDLRVSLLPTHFGEKIVMRLLNLDASFELEKLGFLENEIAVLKKAIQFDDGVVIVSGPTGSGKTRTLYSLLTAIGPSRFNIVTLEDPIEYRIEGLNQVQVGRKMTFADALRSVLRQDPDVILVGEIRDSETAKLCFQAAETGHLVFSTLHANGALEVVERLKGLGVDGLTLTSNLRLSMAQRLEQQTCPYCSKVVPTELVLNRFRKEQAEHYSASPMLVRQKSKDHQKCEHCLEGVSGRIPILEWAETATEAESGKKVTSLIRSLAEARMVRMFRGDISWEEVGYEDFES